MREEQPRSYRVQLAAGCFPTVAKGDERAGLDAPMEPVSAGLLLQQLDRRQVSTPACGHRASSRV